MKRARSTGFTLIELLVVIAIIAILMSLLVVGIVNVRDWAMYKATRGQIHQLDTACGDYRLENGQYPPMTYSGSENLHFYLGSPRPVPGGSDKPPFIEFRKSSLAPGVTSQYPPPPSLVYDSWGRVIQYANPGTLNPGQIDIVSEGRTTGYAPDDVVNRQSDND